MRAIVLIAAVAWLQVRASEPAGNCRAVTSLHRNHSSGVQFVSARKRILREEIRDQKLEMEVAAARAKARMARLREWKEHLRDLKDKEKRPKIERPRRP